jgi:hypothetical protein
MDENRWVVIGVDPGKFGSIVGIGKEGVLFAEAVPLIGIQADKTKYDYHKVRAMIDPAVWAANGFTVIGIYIEVPPSIVMAPEMKGGKPVFDPITHKVKFRMIPAKGVTRELAYAIMGMAIAWRIPYDLFTPKIWQDEVLGGYNKGNKSIAIEYVQRKYPLFELTGNKQVKTGKADAICVADCGLSKNVPF